MYTLYKAETDGNSLCVFSEKEHACVFLAQILATFQETLPCVNKWVQVRRRYHFSCINDFFPPHTTLTHSDSVSNSSQLAPMSLQSIPVLSYSSFLPLNVFDILKAIKYNYISVVSDLVPTVLCTLEVAAVSVLQSSILKCFKQLNHFMPFQFSFLYK